MRLNRIQEYLKSRGLPFQYTEEDGCGSLDFDYRGIGYHVWEFLDGTYGAESNVRNGGKQEEFTGDYETEIISVMKGWK